jgi:hypothetical protein
LGESTLDLLWTNPAPTAAFAAQNIAIDLSKYTHVAISLLWATSSQNITIAEATKNLCIINASNVMVSAPSSSGFGATARGITTSESGIAFTIGRDNASSATSINFAIPYRIYGIKLA